MRGSGGRSPEPAWLQSVHNDEMRLAMRKAAAGAAPGFDAKMRRAHRHSDRAALTGATMRVVHGEARGMPGRPAEDKGHGGVGGLPYLSRFSKRVLVSKPPAATVDIAPEKFYDPLAHKAMRKAAPPSRSSLRTADSGTLDDLAHNRGPLAHIQQLLLRGANDPKRRPKKTHYSPEKHGTIADFPPEGVLYDSPPNRPSTGMRRHVAATRKRLGESSIFSETLDGEREEEEEERGMKRGARYDPMKEEGVASLERTAPPSLRPTDAMRRFTLFRVRHTSPKKVTKAAKREEEERERAHEAMHTGVLLKRAEVREADAVLPIRGGGDPYAALKAASGIEATEVEKVEGAEEEEKGGGSSARSEGGRRGGSRRSSRDEGGLELGEVGVSRANKMGSAMHAPGAHNRRGTGMVKGVLTVGFGMMPDVSAEARKWGTVERVEFDKDVGRLHIVLMPQYYDAFAIAMEKATKGQFHFAAKLNPPLFVAEIGSLSNLMSRRDKRIADGKDPDAESTPMSTARSALDSARRSVASGGSVLGSARGGGGEVGSPRMEVAKGAKKPRRGRRGSLVDERLSEHQRKLKETLGLASDLDIARFHVFNAWDELQLLIDRYYRYLAKSNEMGYLKMEKLMEIGVPTIPDQVRRESDKLHPEYPRRRIEMLLEAEEHGSLEPKWGACMERGVIPRVYPRINAFGADGNTALHEAARAGHHDTVKRLISWGAERWRKNMRGQTPLDLARARSNSAKLALGMGAPGAAARRREDAKLVHILDDRTLLATAQQGDTRRVRYLVEDAHEEPNLTNKYGMTPLHFACMNKDIDMVRVLVANGADPDAMNNVGQSPRHIIENMGLEGEAELGKAMEKTMDEALEEWTRESRRREERKKRRKDMGSRLDAAAPALRRLTAGTSASRAVFASFPASSRKAKGSKSKTTRKAALSLAPSAGGDTRGLAAATRARARSIPAVHAWTRHAVSYLAKTARHDTQSHLDKVAKAELKGPKEMVDAIQHDGFADPKPDSERFDSWLSARFGAAAVDPVHVKKPAE